MIDMQNQTDTREIPLQKAGIKGLRYPIEVLDRAHKTQKTSATVDLCVNLPQHFKGTHMSRFIEVFHKHRGNLSMKGFLAMLGEIRSTLDAVQAYGSVYFPFFMEKKAPVSGQVALMEYDCSYEGTVFSLPQGNCADSNKTEFFVSVTVPVTTLCPCSKAISSYGAHNQRGQVRIKVRNTSFFWIEDLIEVAEQSASGAVYSLLKREDEKYVTEYAYDHPRFVEDVVREVYIGLRDFAKNGKAETPFDWFSVEAENFESIHNHSAFACVQWGSPTV